VALKILMMLVFFALNVDTGDLDKRKEVKGMKKGLLVGLAVVLLVSLGGLIGCGGGGVVGTYVPQDGSGGCLKIYPDHTYAIYTAEGEKDEGGTWEVTDSTILFNEYLPCKIQGNKIIVEGVGVWVKK